MFRLNRIVPVLPVADVQASASWYQSALRFQTSYINQDDETDASWNYAVLLAGEVEIHLSKKQDDDETLASPSNCYVFVEDIEQLYQHLIQIQADVSELKEMPWGNMECWLHDPDGNRLVLSCPRR